MGSLEHGDVGARAQRRRAAWLELAVYVMAAMALWWGTLDTPWISEDASVVRHLTSRSGAADWWRAQYGMESLKFWRPLVSTTFELELALFGPDVVALRLFNMAAHLCGALLLARLARALGAGAFGSAMAGFLALVYPHQGGTVIWLVGRVDSLCWPLVVGAGLAAARGRCATTAVLALLALATKEMGVAALPLCVAAAAVAPGLDDRARRRVMAGAVLGTGGGLLWRALALGRFVGGYPGSDPLEQPFAALWNGFLALGPLTLILPFAFVLALIGHTWRSRAPLVGIAGCAGALVVLSPLLCHGAPRAEHLRWLVIPDGLLCLAWAGLYARRGELDPVRSVPRAALLLLVVAAAIWRFDAARSDVLAWSNAGAQCEAFVAPLRVTLAEEPPHVMPLLAVDVPRLTADGRAYTLHLGLADRFREPLLAGASREVWPWRPLYTSTPELPAGATVRGGFWRPEELVPTLAIEAPLVLDVHGDDTAGARLVPSAGARLDGARVVLVTELGYDHAALPALHAASDLASDAASWSVETILGSSGANALWQTLLLAADAGARRALIAIVTADGSMSRLIELRFDDATVQVLASAN